MPVRIEDAIHGHYGIFYASKACQSACSDIRWGPKSIEVPCHSCLNGTADVYLNIPRIQKTRIERWCDRVNATYVTSSSNGFTFRVGHFSRFRFDDSDESDAEPSQSTVATEEDLAAARLRRAGSTPARPRVGSALTRQMRQQQQQPKEQQQQQRPRMSTRSIADLDDTDPDLEEEEDDISMQHDDSIIPHTSETHQTIDQFPSSSVLEHQHIHNTNGNQSVRNHRTLTFEENDTFSNQQQQQWHPSTHGNNVDVPSVHRLRDALFTPSSRNNSEQLIKSQPTAIDVDMMDTINTPMRNNQYKSEDGNLQQHSQQSEQDYILEIMSKQAEEEIWNQSKKEDDDEDEDDVLHEVFVGSVLPFPDMSKSITMGNYGCIKDTGLMLCRSTRMCFSSIQSHIISTSHDPSRGFTTVISDVHANVKIQSREAFSRLLMTHLSTWIGEDLQYKNHNEVKGKSRMIRVPTLNNAFVDGSVCNSVLEAIIDSLLYLGEVYNDCNASHASLAFGLLLALYKINHGDDGGHEEVNEESLLLNRLTDWIGVAGNVFDDDGIDDVYGLRKAVIALAVGKVEMAVEIAIEQGYYRLAMLISRALEISKEDLRNDIEEQLKMYGFDNIDNNEWEIILEGCDEVNANVSKDERMILLILSGHVKAVAKELNFSWYRLFSMELLYGHYNENLILAWQRILNSINNVNNDIRSPHRDTNDIDVVYLLLKLYTENDSGERFKLMKKVYCNGGFGEIYQPLDYRFSWMLYQIMSAIIPSSEVSNNRFACASLADGFAMQLKSYGAYLWSYYVYCSGAGSHVNILKETLIKDWIAIKNDFAQVQIGKDTEIETLNNHVNDIVDENGVRVAKIGAEVFLKRVLGIPDSWIYEAKAIESRIEKNFMKECENWLNCKTQSGLINCHGILMKQIIPDAIVSNNKQMLIQIYDMLSTIEQGQDESINKNWKWNGGLILGYLKYINGIPELQDCGLNTFRMLAKYVGSYVERKGISDVEKCAGGIIADGVVTGERALLMRVDENESERWLMSILEDLENIPCSKSVRLRLTAEYTLVATHGWHNAQRVAAAFPAYRKYVELLGDRKEVDVEEAEADEEVQDADEDAEDEEGEEEGEEEEGDEEGEEEEGDDDDDDDDDDEQQQQINLVGPQEGARNVVVHKWTGMEDDGDEIMAQ